MNVPKNMVSAQELPRCIFWVGVGLILAIDTALLLLNIVLMWELG
jgi:hypothetical protein